MTTSTLTIGYQRKLQGRTQYRKRLELLKGRMPRLVVRKALKNLTAQVVQYHPDGDRVLLTVHSRELAKYGWKLNRDSVMVSYLVGLLLGKKAVDKNVKQAVLDIAPYNPTKGSRLYAVLQGALAAGMQIPHSKEVLPGEDRVRGTHVEQYAKQLDQSRCAKQFSHYFKQNIKPTEVSKHVDAVKQTILKGIKPAPQVK